MTIPIKTYWAGLAHAMFLMCKFITKHQATLLAVVATVDPADLAAVTAAFTAINSACTLFLHVHSMVDPNAPPSE